MSGMNFSLELSDYWAFSLVHYSLTFVLIVNIKVKWWGGGGGGM